MRLADILGIQAGTLIKGLFVDCDGTAQMHLEGWNIVKQNSATAFRACVDRNFITLEYCCANQVSEMVGKQKLFLYEPGNATPWVLRQNGKVHYLAIECWTRRVQLAVGDCVGMSLGESFLAIQPSHTEVYHSDFYQIYMFHKILHDDTIKWIAMQSKPIIRGMFVRHVSQASLLEVEVHLT